jgi:hypothetical protein
MVAIALLTVILFWKKWLSRLKRWKYNLIHAFDEEIPLFSSIIEKKEFVHLTKYLIETNHQK